MMIQYISKHAWPSGKWQPRFPQPCCISQVFFNCVFLMYGGSHNYRTEVLPIIIIIVTTTAFSIYWCYMIFWTTRRDYGSHIWNRSRVCLWAQRNFVMAELPLVIQSQNTVISFRTLQKSLRLILSPQHYRHYISIHKPQTGPPKINSILNQFCPYFKKW